MKFIIFQCDKCSKKEGLKTFSEKNIAYCICQFCNHNHGENTADWRGYLDKNLKPFKPGDLKKASTK